MTRAGRRRQGFQVARQTVAGQGRWGGWQVRPVVPADVVIAGGFADVLGFAAEPLDSLLGVALVLAGYPVYRIWSRRRP